MNRATWAAISRDSEIWKKIGIGAVSLALVLTTPLALGIVSNDLEAEAQRLRTKSGDPAKNELPATDDLGKLAVDGIGPSMVFFGALCLFLLASIPVGLTYFNLYVFFRPANEVIPEMHQEVQVSIVSVVRFGLIGLVGFLAQCMAAATLPVALAQSARGKDLMPALAVMSNAVTVTEMGVDYWKKAAGVAIGLLGMTSIFVTGAFGMPWYLSTPVCLLVSAIGFVGLILSSRHALAFLHDEFASAALPPLED